MGEIYRTCGNLAWSDPEHLREVGASRGILSIWIGNHRDIAIFWTFSHAWGNEKLKLIFGEELLYGQSWIQSVRQ